MAVQTEDRVVVGRRAAAVRGRESRRARMEGWRVEVRAAVVRELGSVVRRVKVTGRVG